MKMKYSKAQMKIQQMAFMLMAVTLFFVLVGMFVLVIFVSQIQESAETLDERNALLLVTRLANSPEFSCGESFGTGNLNCVDGDKMIVLKDRGSNYDDFWGVENIQVRKIYPSLAQDVECNSGNYPECNIIKIREGQISSEFSNFVSLCRKENVNGEAVDKCEIALLMVSYQENQVSP